MSKKQFKPGFDGLVNEQPAEKPQERPPERVRATYYLDETLINKVERAAYWDRFNISDLVNKILSDHFTAYEKKNGELKDLPEHEKARKDRIKKAISTGRKTKG